MFLCCKSVVWGYIVWMSAHFINEYISKIVLLAYKCQELDDSLIPCIATANIKSGSLENATAVWAGLHVQSLFLVLCFVDIKWPFV